MNPSVIITGATGNLGASILDKLKAKGYHILGTVRSQKSADAITTTGVDASPLDLTNEEAVKAYINQQDKDIAAAVMTVGGFTAGGFEATDGATLRKMYSLNFETTYFLVNALLPVFEKRGGGQFILIGSRPALQPEEGIEEVAYALSKKLVFYLAELINAHGKGKNITATVLVPSTIDTTRNREALPEADFTHWVSREAIADTVAFVLSAAGKQMREGVIKLYNNA